jgi:hypothetical protein
MENRSLDPVYPAGFSMPAQVEIRRLKSRLTCSVTRRF